LNAAKLTILALRVNAVEVTMKWVLGASLPCAYRRARRLAQHDV
jgi:hypothetical protein